MIKKLILPLFLLFLPVALMAQTQSGVVKTRGRLAEDGTVIPGVGLTGASVTVKDGNTVVSGKNGSFKVSLPEKDYYLKEINKSGYIIVDPDFMSQRHSYSREPLLIVMETPAQQIDDRLDAERRIRRTLTLQLRQKEEEIERLKEENRISADDYRKMYQALYEDQESNEDIISDMAGRYSRIDYDQLDSFNEKVSMWILNGELVKADSLIRSKGSLSGRADAILEQQSANAKEEASLNKRLKQLEKKKALTALQRDDLARDCYNMFDIFRLRHEIDSAAHYLEIRASLDTTNATWLTDAAIFAMQYTIDYPKAEQYFDKARIALENEEIPQVIDISSVYADLAVLYRSMGDGEKAVSYYQKSIDVIRDSGLDAPQHLGSSIAMLGAYLSYEGPYEEGIQYLEEALSLMKTGPEESWDFNKIATAYNNMGTGYIRLGLYDKALECFQQSIDLHEAHPSSEIGDGELLAPLINIGSMYSENKEFEKALPYIERAMELTKKSYGEMHPKTASCYGELGYILGMTGHLDEGVEYIHKSIEINTHFYGEVSTEVLPDYNNLGSLYNQNGELELAAKYMEKTLSIVKELGWDNANLGVIFFNCAVVNEKLGNIEKACEFCQNAQDVLERFIPETHPLRIRITEKNEQLKEKRAGLN